MENLKEKITNVQGRSRLLDYYNYKNSYNTRYCTTKSNEIVYMINNYVAEKHQYNIRAYILKKRGFRYIDTEIAELRYEYPFYKNKMAYLALIKLLDKDYVGEGVGKNILDNFELSAYEDGFKKIDGVFNPFIEIAPSEHVENFYLKNGYSLQIEQDCVSLNKSLTANDYYNAKKRLVRLDNGANVFLPFNKTYNHEKSM